ncbi:MAG: hypothetical protein H0U95_05030 [Bacteroidetes bacterium]|nr:hypothetical protein [Bacteroidota bacterium]
MMREQVSITPVLITKAGQVKYFQIKLPKTAKSIIGIELGGKFLKDSKVRGTVTPVALAEPAVPIKDVVKEQGNPSAVITGEVKATPFKRNTLVGDLKLQSCEEANIFYAGELRLDNSIGYGDFSKTNTWQPQTFTHQSLSLEDEVNVDADSTIILGMYKDNIGLENQLDMNYQVNVYVWYAS